MNTGCDAGRKGHQEYPQRETPVNTAFHYNLRTKRTPIKA